MHSNYTLNCFNDLDVLEDVSVIIWNINMPGYELAAALNNIYHFQFSRKDDIMIENSQKPFYSYNNETNHTKYYLIDNIEQPPKSNTINLLKYNKLLILKGSNTSKKKNQIVDDFTLSSMFCDEYDILQQKRYQKIAAIKPYIIKISELDFSDIENPTLNGKPPLKNTIQTIQKDLIYIIDIITEQEDLEIYQRSHTLKNQIQQDKQESCSADND